MSRVGHHFSEPLAKEEAMALASPESRDEVLQHWRFTGEYVTDSHTEWWCPTEERWVWCSGPCPDGTKHSQTREVITQMKIMVRQ